ncbi:hypothetical protein CEXT_172971 [Caerostris extrusa]|uniref:Uncharacterized protein n=1 Tax=Caerostris extrusa TaxID=172846 RepID=A0AAV4P5U1_CAEEX|nr:hypothetical protein CEXT_172971 [Caerostris extrusa]
MLIICSLPVWLLFEKHFPTRQYHALSSHISELPQCWGLMFGLCRGPICHGQGAASGGALLPSVTPSHETGTLPRRIRAATSTTPSGVQLCIEKFILRHNQVCKMASDGGFESCSDYLVEYPLSASQCKSGCTSIALRYSSATAWHSGGRYRPSAEADSCHCGRKGSGFH